MQNSIYQFSIGHARTPNMIEYPSHSHQTHAPPRTTLHTKPGPLTQKINRATGPFLKIDMQHEAYRHGKRDK